MRNYLLLLLIAAIVYICPGGESRAVDFSPKIRTFLIEERIILEGLPKNTAGLRIWMPYPVTNEWQTIDDFKLSGSFDADIITDKERGNKILFLKPKQNRARGNRYEITLSFRAERKESSASSGLPLR